MTSHQLDASLLREYENDALYNAEFLELDADYQYLRHTRIYILPDNVYIVALNDCGGDLVVDFNDVNNCLEITRSSVNIDLERNLPYTFKLSVEEPQYCSIYQLCDKVESWSVFLRSFRLEQKTDDGKTTTKGNRVLPKVTFCDDSAMDKDYSDSESDCSSLSEGSSADDIGLPRCINLCVHGQGLGSAMSSFNVNNAMMMMNPGHVRRLTVGRDLKRASVDVFGLVTDENDVIHRSNSYPQLNVCTKIGRTRSLPNLTDLNTILLDEDLRYCNETTAESRRGSYNRLKIGIASTTSYLSSVQYRSEFGKSHATTNKDLVLNEKIGRLISQPSTIKFNYSPRMKKEHDPEDSQAAVVSSADTFNGLKANEQTPKQRNLVEVDGTPGKFKLNFRRFWRKRDKLATKSEPNVAENCSKQVVFVNKLAVDYRNNVQAMPSFAVTADRRGGFGSDATGKKESLTLSSVTRQSKDIQTPLGKDTIRKKIVKRILSPITILRSVSEEDKTIADISVTSDDQINHNSSVNEAQKTPKKFLDMNPHYLANELTLIDKELLIRIPWNELSTCGWMTKDKYLRSPNVMSMVEFFNRIALVVASEILFEVDPIMRVRVISKVIQVANKLRSIGNFNSLKALLGGLQCTPIYRLKETWKEVSSKRKKNFRDLSRLMSEEDNFAAYRQELNNFISQGNACLPFLGDFLTQIAQTQTYLACRKKSPDKPKTADDNTPPRARPTDLNCCKQSRTKFNLVRRRACTTTASDVAYSKSSPNLTSSCVRTPDRGPHYRMNRFRRCRSWQYSNDSGIQVNTSDTSSLSASSNSFRTSNNSLGSGTFAFQRTSTNESPGHQDSLRLHRMLGRSGSTTYTPPAKSSSRTKLRRNRSVSEKCLAVSTSGNNLKTRTSLLRSFRRTKSMDQAPSSESIQKLYTTKGENGHTPNKTSDTRLTPKKSKSDHDTNDDESGTELQLWHFHMSAIQYNFPCREHIKQFLLTTPFNTEEDNYKLSLEREPSTKKRDNLLA